MMSLNPGVLNNDSLPLPVGGGAHARPRKMYGRVLYPFYMLFIALFISFWKGSATVLGTTLVVVAAASTYFGWQALSEYEIFKNTPVSKIDGAAAGLCEVETAPEPVRGDWVANPMTGEKCIYYSMELHYRTRSKNSTDTIEWSRRAGVPCLLGDGTGYLYADYRNAEVGYYTSTYSIDDKKWSDPEERNELLGVLGTANDKEKLDFTRLSQNICISQTADMKPQIEYTSLELHTKPGGFYFFVEYLPADAHYFVVSSLSDTGKVFKGKPLKLAAADPAKRMFSVLPEPKEKAMQYLSKYVVADLGLAVACIVVAAVIFRL